MSSVALAYRDNGVGHEGVERVYTWGSLHGSKRVPAPRGVGTFVICVVASHVSQLHNTVGETVVTAIIIISYSG